VRLLFDENLAPHLAAAFQHYFPGSTHVHLAGLGSALDDEVWNYARDNGFTIVTKDADYHERSLIHGYPPKVIWVRLGNVTTAQIEQALREQAEAIRRLDEDKDLAVLIVSPGS
jgi:predicted nuclease of predicted toxin-antitoxin system